MDYSKVQYITHHPHPDPDTGELVGVLNPHFKIENEDGSSIAIPIDPLNRHYQELAQWYKEQDQKPFEFDFEGV